MCTCLESTQRGCCHKTQSIWIRSHAPRAICRKLDVARADQNLRMAGGCLAHLLVQFSWLAAQRSYFGTGRRHGLLPAKWDCLWARTPGSGTSSIAEGLCILVAVPRAGLEHRPVPCLSTWNFSVIGDLVHKIASPPSSPFCDLLV